MQRRTLLVQAISIATISFAGCASLTSDDDVQDSDGDGVIDSQDYAPQDPAVQEKSDVLTPTPTASEPNPSVDFFAARAPRGDANQVSAEVNLDGAESVVIEHEGEQIGQYNESGHQVFHSLDHEPIVREGETVVAYARYNGERHQIKEWNVVGY